MAVMGGMKKLISLSPLPLVALACLPICKPLKVMAAAAVGQVGLGGMGIPMLSIFNVVLHPPIVFHLVIISRRE